MPRIWRYSARDGILLLFIVGQFVATNIWLYYAADMPIWLHVVLVLAMAYFHFYNTIVATHNLLHCPFFRAKSANKLMSFVNSANLFVPQSLYFAHHMVHHRFNNDRVVGGVTRDPSSTFRYGKNGQHEAVWKYVALGIFRGTDFAWREAVKMGMKRQVQLEFLVIMAILLCWLAINPLWVVCCFVPVFYLSWCLTHLENYYDHYRAKDPANYYANSVSYYGKWFNLLFFNEGYHQEHHIAPGCHWTQRPKFVSKVGPKLRQAGCKPAKYISILGFLEKDD